MTNIQEVEYSRLYQIDRVVLHDFFQKAFDIDDEDSQDLDEWISIDEILSNLNTGALFVATIGNLIIGAVFIDKQNKYTYVDGKKLEIYIIGVDRQYRKNGVATGLLGCIEKYAKEVNAKKIIANTHIDLVDVQNFYIRNGYKMIGKLENYYDNGDAMFMQKET
jgi:ribosomal protein S18 acetylase RimI-like enzyme